MIFVLMVIMFIVFFVSDIRGVIKDVRRSRAFRRLPPEEQERQLEIRHENLERNGSLRPYHMVPYSVEWGGVYERKCYCDGSICGTVTPRRPNIAMPHSPSPVITPQAGDFTPQNAVEAVAEVAEGRLWLRDVPTQ